MRYRSLKFLFIFLLGQVSSVHGAPPAVMPTSQSGDLGAAADGMVGIVVNQTITPNGYEFYRIFSLLWSEKPDSGAYSLSIKESLSKRYGNRVDIYLGQQRVYSAALPQKYDGLHTLCGQAVEETQTNLVALSLQKNNDADIAQEKM